jgi:PIN domain nuclease of toxin-antitoxin system
MTLLLDTHTALWMAEGSERLGRKARQACVDALARNELAVPSIVFFEVGFLSSRGKLRPLVALRDWHAGMRSLGIRELPLSVEIAIRASEIGNLTGDPIDRLIVATALVEDAVLLTADGSLLAWPGEVRRQDAQR